MNKIISFLRALQCLRLGLIYRLMPFENNVGRVMERAWISGMLQRYPYWAQGHALVGEIALDCDDVAAGYAAALAGLELCDAGPQRAKFMHLLGRCYLRRGQEERALRSFEQARAAGYQDYEIVEDMAAAELALGNLARAKELIESIPVEQRTQGAKVTLKYIQGKG